MYLTISQTAEYLNISTTQITRIYKNGTFPQPYSFGKKALRFNQDEINEWIKSRKLEQTKDIKLIPIYKKKIEKVSKKLNNKELAKYLDDLNKYGPLANGTA